MNDSALPIDLNVRLDGGTNRDDFVADVLPFPVAIRPYDQSVTLLHLPL